MFTGIIEELGRVIALDTRPIGARLTIECSKVLNDATLGQSIAVNGACLTVIALAHEQFSADLAPETLKRTNLGLLSAGSPVNLERPLRADGRLEGHFVLGHVDDTTRVISLENLGKDNWWLRVQVAGHLTRYIVEKGSVALDGISLTVAELQDSIISFAIIPHTYEHTTLFSYRAGSLVNVEVDILAKHLEKLHLT